MAANTIKLIAGTLEKALAQAATSTMDDGALLGAFVEQRNEAAFAELVRRHGPMVLGVGLRVLGHRQDAEDAFQATFLALARKAASVSPRNLVGNWLHGVARQTAVRARAVALKQRTRERTTASPPERAVVPEAGWDDVATILDEELSRLPEHYRAVVLLCDVEGRSRRDAAAHLGCPEGSISSRLSRARAMLARRLSSRNVTLSAGALGFLMDQNATSASVSTTLFQGTVAAARAVAGGTTLVASASPAVSSLMQGVLQAMFLTKLKAATVLGLFVAILGGAGAIVFGVAIGQESRIKSVPSEDTVEKAPKDDKKPLTAQELTGKWFGEMENHHGIRKLSATIDFDIALGGGDDVRWRLRYETAESGAAEIGVDGRKIEDASTGRVNLRFENGKVVLGHLARGTNGTIVLTMLPEIEKRNEKSELIYRRFEGLILRRKAEPKAPGDSGLTRTGNHLALGEEGKHVARTDGWSEPRNQLQARLVLVEEGQVNGPPQIVPYLELRTAESRLKVRCDRRHALFTLVDAEGKERSGSSLPGNGTPSDDAGTVSVPAKSSARVWMGSPGWGIPKGAAAMLTAGSGAWVLEPKDKGKVFLRLTLHGNQIDNDPDRIPTWHGKIERQVAVTWGEPTGPDAPKKLLDTMEGFRTKLPPEQGLEEHNGPSVKETEPYLLTHLEGIARRLGVSTKAECIVLLPYLKDEDPKLRYIAMSALEGKVKAFPSGLNVEAFTDRKGDVHRKMVLRYAELVARLAE